MLPIRERNANPPIIYQRKDGSVRIMKIRTNPARNGEHFKNDLLRKGFTPVRFGVPSPVGRVVKGAIVATTYAGKRAWWLLGRVYVRKNNK